MSDTYRLDAREGGLLPSLRGFLSQMLSSGAVQAVLSPRHRPSKRLVMPALITSAEGLAEVDPLAPCFPLNAAGLAARLTRKPMGARWAALLRPCEIRAWVELVKLKQARTGEVLMIGIDCLGAFRNKDYLQAAGADPVAFTADFTRRALAGESFDPDLAPACRSCEFPVAPWSDLHVGFLGVGDTGGALLLEARSQAGRETVAALKLPPCEPPASRKVAVEALAARRTENRDRMLAATRAAVDSVDKSAAYFADCVNCYNCRVACPVCYCKECVFVTDVFNHEPAQVLQWAGRGGALKLPSDTLFYHLTRLAHMSTACVGCGQCSNACPNEVPVMELFRTVAHRTQQAFGYQSGRDLEEAPPLTVFKESEFAEVVGLGRGQAAAAVPARN